MRCADFAADQYEMYALGLLEPERAQLLSSHLNDACETCLQGVRRSFTFWALFGATAAGPAPAAQLQVAVPASSTHEPTAPAFSGVTPFPAPRRAKSTWQTWAAAAALVAVSLSVGTWLWTRSNVNQAPAQSRTEGRSTPNASEQLQVRIQQLESERDRAIRNSQEAQRRLEDANRAVLRVTAELAASRTTLAQLRQPSVPPPSRVPPPSPTPSNSIDELSRLRAELASAQTTVTTQQAEQARLQQQLAVVERSSQAAQEQLRTLTAQTAALAEERTRLTQTLAATQQRDGQNARILTALAEPGARFVALRGTEAAPNARGYTVLTPSGRSLFYAAGLPDLPAGRDYQLWLIRSRTPAVVSGGIFRPSRALSARLDFTSIGSTTDVVGIAVTDEPAGGSAQPTGHKLLAGTGRS